MAVMRLGLACLFVLSAVAQEEAKKPAPGILFIMADDLGYGDLGCYGNPVIRTPHLDALAKEGMRFTDAYAPHPVCSPTRAALMTGHSPARVGMTNHIPPSDTYAPWDSPFLAAETIDRLDPNEVTLPELLSEAGFRTAHFGKWHLMGPYEYMGRGDAKCTPTRHGFEVNVGGSSFGGPPTFFDPYGIYTLPSREPGEYLPDRLVDEAGDWIAGLDSDEPFYLNLWHYSPHWPIEAPIDDVMAYLEHVGQPGCKDYIYAAMVTRLDAAIGALLARLEELGRAETTMVVFMSDNGGWSDVSDLRPLRGSKGYLYEGGIKSPLIVRLPGQVEAGSECTVPAIGTDLFPTFLEFAGAEVPEVCDGESLLGLFRGEVDTRETPLFWHYPNYAWHGGNRLGAAIREGRWKLILRFHEEELELYDVEADPGETKNLAEKEAERAAAMKRTLAQWLVDTGAKMPKRR